MPKKELYLDQMIGNNMMPVKCGGETTPLEMSKNGVKCNYPVEFSSLKVDGLDVDKWQSHFINTGFYGSSSKMYMPLNGYILEQTSPTGSNEYIGFVAPYDGVLDFIVMRSESACGFSRCGLHKSSTGTEVPNATETEAIAVDMTTDDTAYKFQFTSAASFTAGDILAFSFDPTSSSYDTNSTIVLRFNRKESL